MIHFSFYITFVFLTTTATITFIEAISTNTPFVRHVMNLETCISIIASFFYYIFITKLDEYKKQNIPIDWKEFTSLRYFDWSLTTPFMLLSLCLFLGYNVRVPLTLSVIVPIWILNYIMLYVGFLGETGELNRITACIGGFIPFLMAMYIIFANFIQNKNNMANNILFLFYFIIWFLYGIVYLFSEEYKNIIMNFLDLTAKCLVGISMWAFYVKILRF
jgi:bacteriorhodopsin